MDWEDDFDDAELLESVLAAEASQAPIAPPREEAAADEDDAWASHRRAAAAGGFYAVCPDFDAQLAFALEAPPADLAPLRAAAAAETNETQRAVLAYVLGAVDAAAPALSHPTTQSSQMAAAPWSAGPPSKTPFRGLAPRSQPHTGAKQLEPRLKAVSESPAPPAERTTTQASPQREPCATALAPPAAPPRPAAPWSSISSLTAASAPAPAPAAPASRVRGEWSDEDDGDAGKPVADSQKTLDSSSSSSSEDEDEDAGARARAKRTMPWEKRRNRHGAAAAKKKKARMPWERSASELPALAFHGNLVYAASVAQADEACLELEAALARAAGLKTTLWAAALGFDVEWKVTYEAGAPPRRVATVQLAAADVAAVFHVSRIGLVPPSLAALLARETVVKVGVAARNDARKLRDDYGLGDDGVFPVEDCRDLADDARIRGARGLADLVASALKRSLPKPEQTRRGDWEKYPLPREAREYAALDAYASFRTYAALDARLPADRRPVLAETTNAAADPSPCEPKRTSTAWADRVDALPTVDKVAPAKRRAYDAYFADGRSARAIASDRDIKVTTVLNYIADAVAAGLAYDWARLAEEIGAPRAGIASALEAGTPQGEVRREVAGAEYWMIKVVATHHARLAAAAPPPPPPDEPDAPPPPPPDISEFRLFFLD